MIVQIKTFFVIAQKSTDVPEHTKMMAVQERLEAQINTFLSSTLSDSKNYHIGDVRIWSGSDPLSLHGLIMYQVNNL